MIMKTLVWAGLGLAMAMVVDSYSSTKITGRQAIALKAKDTVTSSSNHNTAHELADVATCAPAVASVAASALPRNEIDTHAALPAGIDASKAIPGAGYWCDQITNTGSLSSKLMARDELIGMGVQGYEAVRPLLLKKDRVTRIMAITVARETGGKLACKDLLMMLSDPDSKVRFHACVALQKICGACLGFRHDAPENERERAIERWRAYLTQNKYL